MINMDHCRFHNTNLALIECLNHIEYEDDRELSALELDSCKRLFKNFIDFLYGERIIDNDSWELDDKLREFFNTFKIKKE